MPAEVLKYLQIMLEHRDVPVALQHLCMERGEVDLEFGIKLAACVGHLMPMVEQLHRLFQAYCYQQPDNDGCNMDEEIFPATDRLVKCVDIEHGCWDLRLETCFCFCRHRGLRAGGGPLGTFWVGAFGHLRALRQWLDSLPEPTNYRFFAKWPDDSANRS